jgi:hypothetical protein
VRRRPRSLARHNAKEASRSLKHSRPGKKSVPGKRLLISRNLSKVTRLDQLQLVSGQASPFPQERSNFQTSTLQLDT